MTKIHVIHQAYYTDCPYHVHAEGCADLRKRQYAGNPDAKIVDEFPSLRDLTEDYYGPQMRESDSTWEEYAGEFKVFPCVRWAS